MNIKNIFKRSESTEKFNRKTLFKRGGYAIALIAIVLAGVIALNVLFTALGNRFTLTLDLSFSGENSISEENAEFLKGIDKPVSITVCADKASYTNGTLKDIAYNYFYIFDDDGYYNQTIKLIDLYATYNPNITVEYIDLTSTAGSAIASEYPSIFYGDIIVRCTDKDGNTNSKLVGYKDIYTYEDMSGYGYYYSITGNKLETALSSAINSVVSGKTKTSAVLSAYTNKEVFDTLFGSQLKLNSFDLIEITDNVLSSIPEGVEQLYMVCPEKDMMAEELTLLNKWLYNDGQLGRSLIFIPNTSIKNIPNIIEFLKEWGISYADGVLYETNSSNHLPSYPTALFSFNNETDLKGIQSDSDRYISNNNLPMTTIYENYDSKETNIIASTSDATVAAPLGIDEKWTPDSSYEKKSYPTLIVTNDSAVVDGTYKSSYVAAFSSADFIYSYYATQASACGNLELSLNAATVLAGFDTDAQLLFIDKTVTVESFADQISESGAAVIRIIFVVLTPILLIAAGFVIWFRRKNR